MTASGLQLQEHHDGILSRIGRSLQHRGLAKTARRGWHAARTSYREWRLGIRTVGSIDGELLDFEAANFGYQPIPYDSLDAAFRHIDVTPQQDVFLDYGCGMGRAVIHAALRPFARVVGVELSAKMCQIARHNVAQAELKLACPHVSIIEADAGRYLVPDDVTVVFMFNPFDTPVVQAVLDQLLDSLRRKPRDLAIIYGLPKCRADILAKTSWASRPSENRDDRLGLAAAGRLRIVDRRTFALTGEQSESRDERQQSRDNCEETTSDKGQRLRTLPVKANRMNVELRKPDKLTEQRSRVVETLSERESIAGQPVFLPRIYTGGRARSRGCRSRCAAVRGSSCRLLSFSASREAHRKAGWRAALGLPRNHHAANPAIRPATSPATV